MSWIQKLCQVYDAMSEVENCGIVPVGFTTKAIKYNIILSAEGEFVTAQELSQEEQRCIVASIPEAEGRTGNQPVPFPLADGIKYMLACEGAENLRFDAYLGQLSKWCEIAEAPQCLKTVRDYLQKRTLFQDLQSVAGLKLKAKKGGEPTDIPGDACFSVETLDGDSRLWMREDVKQSWSAYLASLEPGRAELCYATGKVLPVLENHPKVGVNAKLISARDAGYPFQYRGRFTEGGSAAFVSRMASAKAHAALQWLMGNQGFNRYGMQIVGWNVNNPALETGHVEEIAKTADAWEDDMPDEPEEPNRPDAFDGYARALRDALLGEYAQLDKFSTDANLTAEDRKRRDEIVILAMQAATPGRMSITFYQELPGNVYKENLRDWEIKCSWELPEKGGATGVKSPSWMAICEASMGKDAVNLAKGDMRCDKAATKQMREMHMRLLAGMINKKALPVDMVERAFRRAVTPTAFTDENGSWSSFDWQRCVAVTCAMIRKLYMDKEKRELSPVLDAHAKDRDYLFGRLLAVAHKIELDTMRSKGRKKIRTAAVQCIPAYVQSPEKGWLHLYCRLLPKLKEVGQNDNRARWYQGLLGEIETRFLPEERSDHRPLSYLFLIGFYAQLRELYRPMEERQKSPELPPYTLPETRDELFGCLLAVADECQWQAEAEDNGIRRVSAHDGATNAMRLMTAFTAKPCTTWGHIHDKLIPYLEKLGVEKGTWVQKLISAIERRFTLTDRLSDASLSSAFLHGYLSLRRALMTQDILHAELRQERKMQPEISTRAAAYGALLALENQVERQVLDLDPDPAQNRFSNAVRFLQRASRRPGELLSYLLERMEPYADRLPCRRMVDKEKKRLLDLIDSNDWSGAEPLHLGYLHTFYTYELNLANRKEK